MGLFQPSKLYWKSNKDNALHSNHRENFSTGASKTVPRPYLEVAQITGEHHLGQRSAVCSRGNERVEQVVGHPDKVVNCLPSTNYHKWLLTYL